RLGRLPGERLPGGFSTVAPDLVAEVVSPGDTFYEINQKVNEYLAAGVRLIWVVNTQAREVIIFRPAGSPGSVKEGGELDGEDVIPGFRLALKTLFPPASESP